MVQEEKVQRETHRRRERDVTNVNFVGKVNSLHCWGFYLRQVTKTVAEKPRFRILSFN
jgi:hypothetical protein